jgi:hypothetical protein
MTSQMAEQAAVNVHKVILSVPIGGKGEDATATNECGYIPELTHRR